VDSHVPTLPHVIPYHLSIEPWKYHQQLQQQGYGRGGGGSGGFHSSSQQEYHGKGTIYME